MFSKKGFVDWTQAAQLLQTAVEIQSEWFVSILDLVLKWSAVRLVEAQTALVNALLELLSNILLSLAAQGYQLDDGETVCFLGHMIDLVLGHNNAKFRTWTRRLLHDLGSVYPDQRILSYVVNGWRHSKNKRVISECLGVAGELIGHSGLQLIGSAQGNQRRKLILQLGQFVGSLDKSVRSAALGAIEQVFIFVFCSL